MSLTMTKEERDVFLAEVHVAIISIPERGRGPLTVPVWYAYVPEGEFHIYCDMVLSHLLKLTFAVLVCGWY